MTVNTDSEWTTEDFGPEPRFLLLLHTLPLELWERGIGCPFLCLWFPLPLCQVDKFKDLDFLLLSLLLWPRGNAAKEWDIHGTSTPASPVTPVQPGLFGENFLFKSHLILRCIYFYVMCVSICPHQTCIMCVSGAWGITRCCIFWNWNYRWLWVSKWVLGIKHRFSEELKMLLTFESHLQLQGKSYFKERDTGRLKS